MIDYIFFSLLLIFTINFYHMNVFFKLSLPYHHQKIIHS